MYWVVDITLQLSVTYSKLNNPLYGTYRLKLHNNTIAIIDELGVLSVSNAGWASNTTKERLNGIPGVSVNQKNWNWYLNGNEWSGEWTRIGIVH
jgi:hypothetical protein